MSLCEVCKSEEAVSGGLYCSKKCRTKANNLKRAAPLRQILRSSRTPYDVARAARLAVFADLLQRGYTTFVRLDGGPLEPFILQTPSGHYLHNVQIFLRLPPVLPTDPWVRITDDGSVEYHLKTEGAESEDPAPQEPRDLRVPPPPEVSPGG